MNRKAIFGIVGAVVLAISIVGVIMFMRGSKKEPEVAHNPNNSALASTIAPGIENMNEKEVEAVLNEPVTQEKVEAFNNAIDIIEMPDASKTEVKEDGELYYKVEDGEDVHVEVDEEVMNRTDEEAEEDFNEIMAKLDEISKTGVIPDKEDVDNTPVPINQENPDNQNTTTPVNPDNNDDNQQGTATAPGTTIEQPSGDTWDQNFYNSLTPEQQAAYKNGDDSTRQQMKQFIEASRDLTEQGYHGDWSDDQEANEEAWSHITVEP